MDNALEETAPGEAAGPVQKRLVEFVLPMVIVGVDQATKAMVRASLPLLEQYARQLPMLFIVSDVEIRPAPTDPSTRDDESARSGQASITIERAAGVKCERCWRIVPKISSEPASAGLCDRCQDALAETVNG